MYGSYRYIVSTLFLKLNAWICNSWVYVRFPIWTEDYPFWELFGRGIGL